MECDRLIVRNDNNAEFYYKSEIIIATILDIRFKRKNFLGQIKKGFTQIQNGEIKKWAFSLNLETARIFV